MQRAWLARFGRTAAQHVLDGVQARLTAPRQAGMRATVVGHALGNGDAATAPDGFQTLPEWVGDEATAVRVEPQLLTIRDLVTRSAFTLSGETDGGFGAVWGRGAHSGFEGSVTTGVLGADYAAGPWVVGLSLAHSRGSGSWRHAPSGSKGDAASSLTGLYPYAGCDLTERLSLRGVVGYGQDDVTLTLRDGASYRTDVDLTMTALGVRGDLVPRQRESGLSLAFESDVLLVRTTSDAASGPSGLLAATAADVSRLRLGLEGALELALASGGSFTPGLELGLRHDGGDAETGFWRGGWRRVRFCRRGAGSDGRGNGARPGGARDFELPGLGRVGIAALRPNAVFGPRPVGVAGALVGCVGLGWRGCTSGTRNRVRAGSERHG